MSKLFSPIEIPGLSLANHLVMPPMATAKTGEDGLVTPALEDYYDEKSQGGYIGLIITEHSFVSPEGRAHHAQVSVAEDTAIPGLKRIVERIHQNGSKAIAQINHAGAAAKEEVTGSSPIGPSAAPLPRAKEGDPLPCEMSAEDIYRVTEAFAAAARRVKEAGFDGVEIHSAHGYLLNQFYSPLTNRRTDAYGGSLENRIRFHLEVIAAVRAAVGEAYPVALRLGACDYIDGGSTVEDAVKACVAFERAGVCLLDITGGLTGYVRPGHSEPGYFSGASKAVREAVSVPVILTGGVTRPEDAERLLSEEKADLIGVGRAVLKDSEWGKKAKEALG